MEKCCYNCKHNGKDTCKGCSTIALAGKVFENFRPRDEFKKIEKLEKQLAEKDKEIETLKNDCELIAMSNSGLAKMVAKKDRELLKYKIKDTSGLSNFIDEEVQKQTIKYLFRVKEIFSRNYRESKSLTSMWEKFWEDFDSLVSEIKNERGER